MRDEAAARMRAELKQDREGAGAPAAAPTGELEAQGQANLEQHPEMALELLEADQIVAAKERTRFGLRRLSRGERALLWSLRVYVVVMLVIVAFWVFQTLHVTH